MKEVASCQRTAAAGRRPSPPEGLLCAARALVLVGAGAVLLGGLGHLRSGAICSLRCSPRSTTDAVVLVGGAGVLALILPRGRAGTGVLNNGLCLTDAHGN
jgi:hypothetical protein